MSSEFLAFICIVVGAVIPLYAKRRVVLSKTGMIVLGLAVTTVVGSKFWSDQRSRYLIDEGEFLKTMPTEERTGDFVSSETCQSCHPNQYASWFRSYHRTMTQYATEESVRADFDNVRLNARGEVYHLENRDGEFWVDMPDPDWKGEQATQRGLQDFSTLTNAPRATKRISMVTGSHTLQKFWVSSARYGNLQWDLPFTYLLEDRRWVLREDSIVIDPEESMLVQIWNGNCIKCHTTGPRPRRDTQSPRTDTRVVELGISCEACHGPAANHARVNRGFLRRYRNHMRDNHDPTMQNPAHMSSPKASKVCAQCHAMKLSIDNDWMQEGFRFRPGDDLEKDWIVVRPLHRTGNKSIDEAMKRSEVTDNFFWSDGEIRISGREYNGLIESGCHQRGELSCMSCHQLHYPTPSSPRIDEWANDQLGAGMNTNAACLQCHNSFISKAEEHTRHSPDSSGSQCYNCHMPHTNWGLMKAIRSHRITSPSVKSSLETGRPNACNLCHLDRTLEWTANLLEERYGAAPVKIPDEERKISAAILWSLKGDAGQRALMSWHMGWDSALEASGKHWLVPFLAQLLTDSYSVVRYRAHRSLTRIPGFEDLKYDYVGPESHRTRIRDQVLESWSRTAATKSRRSGGAILTGPGGQLDRVLVEDLLQRQDRRSMFLIE